MKPTFGTIPRWAAVPAEGIHEHETAMPDDFATTLAATAGRLGVPPHVLVLAAHTKVLAVLTGEQRIVTGYLAPGREDAAALDLTVRDGSWRELIAHLDRAEPSESEEPPTFETTLDPVGDRHWPDALPAGVVLAIRFERASNRLRLRYRSELIDDDYAGRIAGYHRSALDLITADPDARHGRAKLLSEEEIAFQLEALAGPRRKRPDRAFHELFEERVREQPDAIVAVHGDARLTYRELNRRANRIAWALLARGTVREDVVAVMTERNLDWFAAVLAVFKAGAAYLPIEPRFPADRIATMLTRSGCRLALTEPGSGRALRDAGDVATMVISDLYTGDGPEGDPHVRVEPGQLAYIYFTSGSTGEPKGAMCEHAGLLNHLYAKADDVGIGASDVVAQTAPQCFDISLWQLVCGPLMGGRTVIVGEELILDVEGLIEHLVRERVTVLQVVPSYLDVIVSFLEKHHRPLGSLRHVLVTGEEIKKELVRRWFATVPGIGLINAYGLTETSDDTNHEIMYQVPAQDRVPLGPPVANVRIYLVDESLQPVPLGAAGEIVFSGVCVGRGYINDAERTRLAFGTDPHYPGQRLYRSGDLGRWLPDFKLEFLGRADSQVKIRGFRIEPGEVENALLLVPGVRAGAVVVAERADGTRQLVAFYRSDTETTADELRAVLSRTLPAYMIPAAFHRRDRLPLTANGKIDRKALVRLAADLFRLGTPREAGAGTPAQRQLALAWSQVLSIPVDDIGWSDHFFERGGTSLSAVRLAILLDRLVSPKDMTDHPVLADLATVLEQRCREASESERRV
ncbi:amino acid adenylation domain-containing protein [Amycolatopsis cynarae]|uniref:Amino acid adenylation domain-containing protein n=1 Tax=Amycolatopsis cynarae TaxID=2995223 RepID=A0ABY7AV80_9PSEU|nr:amino acid adenylation domain-containing protein [Amycolatopsis sp. HUAS 11-8]WAL62953.1 amino acid adenylation domain-containing protein [Amycolatopsis sp. HUAS 11-8]